MKQLLIASFMLLGQWIYAGTEYTLTMNYENTIRDFIVHLPTGYSSANARPVVFNLHGYGSNAPQQIFYSRMDITADANNFICVFPNGLNSSWNSGFTPPYNSSPDDVGFLSAIIDTLNELYAVDLNRVYVCGMSNGGYQSYRMACDLESRIAAIASVTGSISSLTALNCNINRPVPVLEIHGTADPLVDYNGGTGYYGTEQTIDFWRTKNGCNAVADTTDVPDTDPLDSSTVKKIKYTNCNNGSEVWLYKIDGGGHTWPDASINYIYGPTNHDINASQEIWDFFNRFTLQGPVNVQDIKRVQVQAFPNPTSDILSVTVKENIAEDNEWSVSDVSGRVLASGKYYTSAFQVSLSEMSSGIYFFQAGGVVLKLIKTQ